MKRLVAVVAVAGTVLVGAAGTAEAAAKPRRYATFKSLANADGIKFGNGRCYDRYRELGGPFVKVRANGRTVRRVRIPTTWRAIKYGPGTMCLRNFRFRAGKNATITFYNGSPKWGYQKVKRCKKVHLGHNALSCIRVRR